MLELGKKNILEEPRSYLMILLKALIIKLFQNNCPVVAGTTVASDLECSFYNCFFK